MSDIPKIGISKFEGLYVVLNICIRSDLKWQKDGLNPADIGAQYVKMLKINAFLGLTYLSSGSIFTAHQIGT